MYACKWAIINEAILPYHSFNIACFRAFAGDRKEKNPLSEKSRGLPGAIDKAGSFSDTGGATGLFGTSQQGWGQ
jgi:hypothetical protein